MDIPNLELPGLPRMQRDLLEKMGIDVDLRRFTTLGAKETIECPICSKKMRNRNLPRHISALHLLERFFKCEVCDFTCAAASNLKQHSCYRKKLPASGRSVAEYALQIQFEQETGGQTVNLPIGRADIVTDTEIIEIKQYDHRVKGLGQLVLYSAYLPGRSLRLHLFHTRHTPEKKLREFVLACNAVGVNVTWEKEASEHY